MPKGYQKVEAKCRKAGHLDSDENLLDRIAKDKQTFTSYGLTPQQIYQNHRNLNLKFNYTNEFGAYTSNGSDAHIELFSKGFPPNYGNGWCCWGRTTNEFRLNGQHLRVTSIVWGGAETCPIEKSFTDKYHGYSRGDRDWLVTNLDRMCSIWIPDLLPSQIGLFGFCQSPSSAYRVEPETYVKVFGLDLNPLVVPQTYQIITKWSTMGYGPMDYTYIEEKISKLDRTVSIVKEISNENFHAIYLDENPQSKSDPHMHIAYKNTDYLKSVDNTDVELFDMDFRMEYTQRLNVYFDHLPQKNIILDGRDDAEEMSLIRKKETGEKCCIQ
jgi:hypothetical protein